MKKLLFYIFTVCCCFHLHAGSKFALVGLDDAGKNAVELVQSELADTINFVERSSIRNIMQEHFLLQQFGIAKLARQFTGADIFIAVQNHTLTAFETRHGFRLAYQKLSSDLEAASREIKQEILKWNKIDKDFSTFRIISFAGIRNNVHRDFAQKTAQYSEMITLAINQTPAILLERDYLVELLLEQELSSGWQAAVSGSEIIHVELNPGSDAEEIIFAAYAVDAKNHTVFKKESTDLPTVLSALHKHCSRPPSKKRYTLKDEARRFASEARIARDDRKYLQAEKLQFAAFALDPENEDFFDFGIVANEKLTNLFPYWFAALKKIVRDPYRLSFYGKYRDISGRLINRIYYDQYELPETLQLEFWNWLSRCRHLWQTGDRIQKFLAVKKEFYPTDAEFLQAKEFAWQTLLNHHFPSQDIYRIAGEVFRYQNALPRHIRQNWTTKNAAILRRRPGLEILAKSLECNAFLRSKECTVDTALAQFEELFSLVKKYPDLKIDFYELVDYPNVHTYIGLAEKVKSACKKSLENKK